MLDSAVLDTIRKKLVAQKEESVGRLEELKASDPFNLEAHDTISSDRTSPDDEAQINEHHERIAAQMETLQKQMIKIDMALDRIKNGSYGICEVCGQPIETTRLTIMPLAGLCLKDEKSMEKKVKKAS